MFLMDKRGNSIIYECMWELEEISVYSTGNSIPIRFSFHVLCFKKIDGVSICCMVTGNNDNLDMKNFK